MNKPAGWLSVAGRGVEAPVLSEWVRERFPESMTVHRLDRETSGILLFARGPDAHRKASLWFQNRQTKKIYRCLASGTPNLPIFRISRPIEGQPSTTQVEVTERFSSAFSADIRPITGRRHQIRIHLAGEGHPLLGDELYRGPCRIPLANGGELEIGRVALHASLLELPSGERFEAPLPEDFSSWLEALRKERS